MKTINNKVYNNKVSEKMVNAFAYEYIPSMIENLKKQYNLPSGISVSRYTFKTYLQLTTYNTKKSTDLAFTANADFYKNVITLQIIDSYTETASYIEIGFDEIEKIKKNNELVDYLNDYIKSAVENANKVVAEYKKEHNLK